MKIQEPHQRLQSLWGLVDLQHNELIATKLVGRRVLDVGCGYGSLVSYLTEQGFDAEGIDFDKRAVGTAHSVFPRAVVKLANTETVEAYPEHSFDSVILKDALHHLVCEGDFTASCRVFHRILKPQGRLVILDPNPMWILRAARRLAAHHDVQVPLPLALEALKQNRFEVLGVQYFETIGLPLSGGYVGVRLVPNIAALNKSVAAANRILSRLANEIGLGSQLCWRYVIHADAARS